MSDSSLLYRTLSVCAVCLRVIEAQLISRDGAVFFRKNCIGHGTSDVMAWPDTEHFRWMNSFTSPINRPKSTASQELGCPRDCGLCARHLEKPRSVEVEVTRGCNLRCPVCSIPAGEVERDPTHDALGKVFREICERTGTTPKIELTGGEPTLRPDLPEIVRIGLHAGLKDINVNTNGIVIARDFDYLLRLKESGLTGIRLQFDGLTAAVCQQIRGADLLAAKLQAIENCRRAGLQVVLAMTIFDDLNLGQLGDVVRFALDNLDVVAELALKPGFIPGRCEAGQLKRLSMGDIIFALADQSRGMLGPYDFLPLGCAHPLCSSGTFLVRNLDGFAPVTRNISPEQYQAAFSQTTPQASAFRGMVAKQTGADANGLWLMISNPMDIWTLELDRLRRCSKVVAAQDGRILPFCSYHLTGCEGQHIHPVVDMKQ
jgi:uncharacterized radical SAM superfamily Fe-S cluster-containing enzyme